MDKEKLKRINELRTELHDKYHDAYAAIQNEQLAMMRRRHDMFTGIVENYTSFADFLRDWRELLTLLGLEIKECDQYVSLYMQLDFTDYEQYHVIMGRDGHLAISSSAWCEMYCANILINIFTGAGVDGEDIVKG